jgi:hypothetical protein
MQGANTTGGSAPTAKGEKRMSQTQDARSNGSVDLTGLKA